MREGERDPDCRRPFLLGALTGGTGVLLTGLMVTLCIAFSDEAFLPAAKVILITYLPLMIAEAAVTGAAIGFVRRVSPALLFVPEHQHG